MWLINTSTLELEEFINHPKRQYVIFSHTWGECETSFRAWKKRRDVQSPGYVKVKKFVNIAHESGYRYAWADTYCINKESSAELSEAINSMFKYYEDAAECYVFLSDLPTVAEIDDDGNSYNQRRKAFLKSRWFTRGWTLQELLAPSAITFFDRGWDTWGSKDTLTADIASAAGVPPKVLDKSLSIQSYPIACRMSWASRRVTIRPEDIAYCLLGIFDIHMPLLYGEGDRAFIRLQEEICKRTNDKSLFAWSMAEPSIQYSGLLSPSPSNFRDFLSVGKTNISVRVDEDEFTITNKGIRFDSVFLYVTRESEILLPLGCSVGSQHLFICIRKVGFGWARLHPHVIFGDDSRTIFQHKEFSLAKIYVLSVAEAGSSISDQISEGTLDFELHGPVEIIAAEPAVYSYPSARGICFAPQPTCFCVVHLAVGSPETSLEEFIILCSPALSEEGLRKAHALQFTILAQCQHYFSRAKQLLGRGPLSKVDGRSMMQILFDMPDHEIDENTYYSSAGSFQGVSSGIHRTLILDGQVCPMVASDGSEYRVVKLRIGTFQKPSNPPIIDSDT
ncbi:heterokaryon incompatibility protein-domain-containing protein [Xylariaceae sp. FL1019]|nr:heterokaryon incompatibility protein-domain-containing protein [Xylariaceae sp. FL1019]